MTTQLFAFLALCYYRCMMEKIVRITKVEEQDETRRDDMQKMSPSDRMEALLKMRDRLYPYSPLERVATIRTLD
jgi:hypothetical protein